MSAVVDFIGDVVETVVDTVGDIVDTTVHLFEDAVDTVVEVVQNVIEDPLPTLIAIAGQAIGIPAPITQAAITAARGGDLEDIVLAAGTAYVAPMATSAISSTLSSVVGDAIINETVSNVVVDGVSRGLVSGAVAEVRGGDFVDGFAGGFTGTVVNSAVGEFTNEFIKPEVEDMLADSGIDQSTINTVVSGGTKAVSAGITAELTGRGDFQDAFVNSVQNTAINTGTKFISSSISDEFRTIETGLQKVDEESEAGETTVATSWDDYFNLETTLNEDRTGAGIGDDLVEQVASSEGDLSPAGTLTQADTWQPDYYQDFGAAKTTTPTTSFEDVIGSSQDVIDEFSGSPAIEQAEEDQFAVDELPGIDWSQYDFTSLPEDIQSWFDYTPGTEEVTPTKETTPTGALAQVAEDYTAAPSEEVLKEKRAIEVPTDPYEGIAEETFGLTGENAVDVAPVNIPGTEKILEGGLNKVASSLVEDKTQQGPGTSGLNYVMQTVVNPAIRQGLTKAIRGTPAKPVMRPPRTKKPLTPAQMAQLQAALAQQRKPPPQKIDMSQIMAQRPKTMAPPPKKVDVSKLTPVTNVASLTALLGGSKG